MSLNKGTCHSWFVVPCLAGGSESSWDKDKLQSPITTGSQHSIGHPTLSGQSSLGSAHPLSPLQQNHLLTNSTYWDPAGKKQCLEPAGGWPCLPSQPRGGGEMMGDTWVTGGAVLPLLAALVPRVQATLWDQSKSTWLFPLGTVTHYWVWDCQSLLDISMAWNERKNNHKVA